MINEYFQFPSFAFVLQTNPSNTQQRHNQSIKIVNPLSLSFMLQTVW